MSVLSIHFFPVGSRISKYILRPGQYKKGSAQLTPDSRQLVNKLWVKGGKAISDNPYSQPITVGTEPIPLYYSPRAPVTVTVEFVYHEPSDLIISEVADPADNASGGRFVELYNAGPDEIVTLGAVMTALVLIALTLTGNIGVWGWIGIVPLATAALGAALPLVATEATEVVKPIIAPMIVAGLGILFSIIGIFMVRTKEEATMKNLLVSLNIGVWASSLLIIAGLAVEPSSQEGLNAGFVVKHCQHSSM